MSIYKTIEKKITLVNLLLYIYFQGFKRLSSTCFDTFRGSAIGLASATVSMLLMTLCFTVCRGSAIGLASATVSMLLMTLCYIVCCMDTSETWGGNYEILKVLALKL